MKFIEVLMTPELAETYLKRNKKNRKLNKNHVNKLASDMNSGRWVLNGETIKFDVDGNLLDGQHRLHGIVLSGISVPMVIALDVEDPNAFKTIDGGRPRGASQIIEMMEIKNSAHVTSISKRLIHWQNTVEKSNFSFETKAFSDIPKADIIQFAEENSEEIIYVLHEVNTSLAFKRCGAGSALVTALILCRRHNDVATTQFIEGIKLGVSLQENSPVIRLRDRLLTPPERRGAKWELELMALVIKSFNKFLYGKSIKVLRWSTVYPNIEKFPIPGANTK